MGHQGFLSPASHLPVHQASSTLFPLYWEFPADLPVLFPTPAFTLYQAQPLFRSLPVTSEEVRSSQRHSQKLLGLEPGSATVHCMTLGRRYKFGACGFL